MDREEQQRVRVARQKVHFEADFNPTHEGPLENQRLTALNYMAFHLGQISKNLARLADAQEKANQSEG